MDEFAAAPPAAPEASTAPQAAPAVPPEPELRSVLAWATARKTDPLVLRATAAARRWEIDPNVVPTEVTAEEFDAAIHSTLHDRL